MKNKSKKLVNPITFQATTDQLQEFVQFIYTNIYFNEQKGLTQPKILYKILADLNSTFIYLKDYESMEEYALLQEINGNLKNKIEKLEKQLKEVYKNNLILEEGEK